MKALSILCPVMAPGLPGRAAGAPASPTWPRQILPHRQDEWSIPPCADADRVVPIAGKAIQCGDTPQPSSPEVGCKRDRRGRFVVPDFATTGLGSQKPVDSVDIALFRSSRFALRLPMIARSGRGSAKDTAVHPLSAALARKTSRAPRVDRDKRLVGGNRPAFVAHGSSPSPQDHVAIVDF